MNLTTAVEMSRAIGNAYGLGRALVALGHARQTRGDHDDAIASWREAHDILTELDNTEETAKIAELLGRSG